MRKKAFSSLAALLSVATFSLANAQGPAAPMAVKQAAIRSVYCNVYLRTACFGIAQGDTLTMEIPVDFMLDSVHMSNGIQATIYMGYNPEDVFAGKSTKNCPVIGSASQCRYAKSPGQYDVLYQADVNARLIHVQITGVNDKNSADAVDFLLGFRRCHAEGQSVQCSDERLFKGIQ